MWLLRTSEAQWQHMQVLDGFGFLEEASCHQESDLCYRICSNLQLLGKFDVSNLQGWFKRRISFEIMDEATMQSAA